MVGIGRKDFRAPASFLAGVGAEKKDGASKINFFFLACNPLGLRLANYRRGAPAREGEFASRRVDFFLFS